MTNLLWRQRDAAPPPDRRYRCSLESLACDRCHFIEGEPADAIYCGCPTEPGSPWCAFHARIVYQRPADLRAINLAPLETNAPSAVCGRFLGP